MLLDSRHPKISAIAAHAQGFAETISDIEIVIRIVESSNPPASKCRFVYPIIEIDDDPKKRSKRGIVDAGRRCQSQNAAETCKSYPQN